MFSFLKFLFSKLYFENCFWKIKKEKGEHGKFSSKKHGKQRFLQSSRIGAAFGRPPHHAYQTNYICHTIYAAK